MRACAAACVPCGRRGREAGRLHAKREGAPCCRRPGILVLINEVDWELRCGRCTARLVLVHGCLPGLLCSLQPSLLAVLCILPPAST